jgi:hypothetical protein
MRGKGRRRRAWRTLKAARRVIVPPAAIFAALVCALFAPPALARAAHRARDLSAHRASALTRVTTIAQLVEKTGIDLRAAAAASRDGKRADAAIAAASCARLRPRRGCPYATWGRGTACMRAS